MPDLPELNPVVHGRLRLALLALLSASKRLSLPGSDED